MHKLKQTHANGLESVCGLKDSNELTFKQAMSMHRWDNGKPSPKLI